jgi:hypothetical protein
LPIRSWSVGRWPVRSRCRSVSKWGWSIRSRCSNNNWSWSISWGWGISWSWGSSVDRLSRVLDISNITIAISIVGNSLETTIGKGNMVFAIGVVTITSFTGTKVGSTV